MGLETAHPDALARLHKRFTLAQFAAAAQHLRDAGVALRVFLLVGVPFVDRAEQRAWVRHSVSCAFDCGASAVSLIPTRTGNGALEALAADGAFEAPSLADVEEAFDDALAVARGRVFVDLWDLDRLADCAACVSDRRARLHRMNLEQRVLPAIRCAQHGASSLVQ
jgi:archaeosine synthase beta-subunit